MFDRPHAPRAPAAAILRGTRLIVARVLTALAVLVLLPVAALAQGPWSGEWQTYWRDGAAILSLDQDGDRVTGTYEPGGGRVEATADGARLVGTWQQRGASGNFVFALDADGAVFTGRYESGEYWNGERIDPAAAATGPFTRTDTPREALRTLLAAGNRVAYEGEPTAMRMVERLMTFEGAPSDSREEALRRRLLWALVDLSTFRLRNAPGSVDGDTAVFRIGPAGTTETFELRFRRASEGWVLVVPPLDVIQTDTARLLDALGHASIDEARAARADSPRGALRRFVLGTKDWDGPGRDRALAALDLSYLPAQLYEIQAPVLADYLKRVLDRAGYPIWQEIPDDPARPTPYEHYRHPAGAIVIERSVTAEGEPGPWLFTADTMRGAPDLFTAMQDLAVADGLRDAAPLTDFFRLRQAVRDRAPALTLRYGLLEAWQWGLLVGAGIAAVLLGWAAGRAATALLRGLDRWLSLELEPATIRRLDWPLRVAVAGMAAIFAFGWLGLAQTALEGASLAITFVTTLAIALVLFRLVGLVGTHLRHRAEETPSVVDQIFVSLATGLVQMLIVIGGIVALAEIVGLPYEGVLTGLGVGGIALAFAARDTVSNLLAGAILMADRPFRQGDLIETDHGLATVELVGPRSTRMRTLDDTLLVLPNAQLTDRGIFNYNKRRRRKILLQIGLTYDTPRDRLDAFVERLSDTYQAQDRADPTSGWVGMTGVGPSSIDIELWGYFRVYSHDGFVKARHALVGDIIELAKEVGVTFAFPTRTVHVAAEGAEPRNQLARPEPAGDVSAADAR
ncbi:mechanosensitive ion channel domain-containing protein [Rhodovulum sp. 12E13]|uniref:mechanosensitive ion channel domain-containing protein n=1 Tax=Rhodovulum sp. 12E13 TaxID=2203891 RepID=UPI0013147828|nr:mechanosensitive ion channel domain-containing protein [Rhodovulum sp. 12E13]